jgi:hypothetical protein
MAILFRVLILFITYGPTIWKIVMEILDLITNSALFMTNTDARIFSESAKRQLDDAVAYYTIAKSTSRLEELHGELSLQLANLKARHI